MLKINGQRGRTLTIPSEWIEFTIRNIDIAMALSGSPLQAHRIAEAAYEGRIFGIRVHAEILGHEVAGRKGIVQILADARLPIGLGRTYTIAKYTYTAIDDTTTSLDFDFSVELTGLMAAYVFCTRSRCDAYLDRVCIDIEKAARVVAGQDTSQNFLTKEQQQRIADFRQSVTQHIRKTKRKMTEVPGTVRVVVAPGLLLLNAEAKMPDGHLISAAETIMLDENEYASLLLGAKRLAAANNPAFAVRGQPDSLPKGSDFRQAALEYGHAFYMRCFSGKLSNVMPVLSAQGKAATLRMSIDASAEGIPWEALYDGQDFLALRLRFSRSASSFVNQADLFSKWESPGVLIVGSNARGDLPGVDSEAENLANLLKGTGLSRIQVLRGGSADRSTLINTIESGHFNIFHYSGHSVFDPAHPNQSYLELCHGTKLFLYELSKVGKGMDLVFLNSCQSAMTGPDLVTGKQLSMCRILRDAGVCVVVGMLWNIQDAAAVQVASSFYRCLMTDPEQGPEEAMRCTRNKVAVASAWADGSWLAPVLYT